MTWTTFYFGALAAAGVREFFRDVTTPCKRCGRTWLNMAPACHQDQEIDLRPRMLCLGLSALSAAMVFVSY